MSEKESTSKPFAALAVFLAWLVPGAGHIYLRRPVRGVVIFIAICVTFWAGMAMGGVLTVDKQSERWWFMAQSLSGVNGLVAWQMQDRFYKQVLPEIRTELGRRPGGSEARGDLYTQVLVDAVMEKHGVALVTPQDTPARAFTGAAGLLNLMCMFDAMMLSIMGVTGEKPRESKADAA